MEILIGGDLCITPEYLSKELFDDSVKSLFRKADYSIVNLECPITFHNESNKILKTGPHLRSNEKIFDKLKYLSVNAVTLSNNHIMDYGKEGLYDTLNYCKKSEIEYVGAGINLNEASEPLFFKKNDLKIAIFNFCENEWSVATEKKAGANPLDIVSNSYQIKKARNDADYIIVIIHGGHEYYDLPSPRMVKQYRYLLDIGADAVIGHHTHCISGYEIHNDKPIVYSLGNLLFTIKSNYSEWYIGLLAHLQIEKDKPIKVSFSPIQQCPKTFKLSALKEANNRHIIKKIEELSSKIKSANSLTDEWEKYIEQNKKVINIMSPINGAPNKYLRGILKRIGLNKILLRRRFLKYTLNQVRCEAHRDVLIEVIKKDLQL